MPSPNFPPTLHQPASTPRLDRPAGSPHARRPLREWRPRLSELPATTLAARLTRAFRMLGFRSEPLVSMLYGRARPGVRASATGRTRGRRR